MVDILRVSGLKTYYFTRNGVVKAVDGVSFRVGRGETLGIVGESGCGKSTVAYSIVRLLPREARIVEGEIIFEGRDLARISDDEMRNIRGKDIAFIFQDPTTSLNPVYNVGFQIAEVFLTHEEVRRDEANAKTIGMLKTVKIPEPERRAKQYPHEFSVGMQQRAMIAMALA